MVRKSLLRLSVLCICLLCAAGLFAQDKNADPEAMQKAWMDYMTPGPIHKMWAESAGEWKFKMKMWMNPAAEPMVSEGTSSNEMILGGRYLKSVRKGSMMGMPFEGWSLMGFDNISMEITAVWYDNGGTGTAIAKGTFDQATNTITLHGSAMDPMSKKEKPSRQTFMFIDKNNQLMEYFMIKGDKEIKIVEVSYSR